MKRIVAIIQARMGSSRLPGKVMKDIVGKNMLWHVVNRVKHAKKLNDIVVATTTLEEDKRILDFVSEMGIKSYAGSEDDVLDRYYQAATTYLVDVIVRITADCPLADPEVIDKVIRCFLKNESDYVSNALDPTYPDGLDVEVFSYKTLEKTFREAKLLSEREHVTPYIKNHPKKFRVSNVRNNVDLSHLRWTVDRKEDLKFVREIYKRLYNKKPIFLMKDILQLLKKYPELKRINAGIQRDEGYLKSLKEETRIEKER